jgi:hypothetical protein
MKTKLILIFILIILGVIGLIIFFKNRSNKPSKPSKPKYDMPYNGSYRYKNKEDALKGCIETGYDRLCTKQEATNYLPDKCKCGWTSDDIPGYYMTSKGWKKGCGTKPETDKGIWNTCGQSKSTSAFCCP